ncbi:hypothetical protein D930_01834 [Enterococcus faecalis KI-6-1-110608-1]|nr:hypothetical protein D930_01834 [Enterococcus faecalis KI-6-1-110608-1]
MYLHFIKQQKRKAHWEMLKKSSRNWLFLLIGLAVASYAVKYHHTGKKA